MPVTKYVDTELVRHLHAAGIRDVGESTIQETLREVRRCTQEGITINTFMLESSPYLMDFVNRMTQINKGRALYTTPDSLGQYVLLDYLTNRTKRIRS